MGELLGMMIRIWIEKREPITGTVATEGQDQLRFEGWLELLAAVSELLAATAPLKGDEEGKEEA